MTTMVEWLNSPEAAWVYFYSGETVRHVNGIGLTPWFADSGGVIYNPKGLKGAEHD